MDLQALAARTGIPIRRLRHCLDHELIPGVELESGANEVGRRRRFNDDVGFAICCAATLGQAGLDRSTVRVFMGGIREVRFTGSERRVIAVVFERKAIAYAELGDMANVRINVEDPGAFDSGWVRLSNGVRRPASYEPLTTIGLNLGYVGKKVFRW